MRWRCSPCGLDPPFAANEERFFAIVAARDVHHTRSAREHRGCAAAHGAMAGARGPEQFVVRESTALRACRFSRD
jgi:hypothetical protein